MIKRWISLFLCLSITLCLLASCQKQETLSEQPIESSSNEVSTVNEIEPTSGEVTRGEWISTLAEAFGLDSYSTDEPYFSDVSANSKLFPAVQAAAEWNILSLYAEKLEPEKLISQKEIALTAAVTAGYRGDNGVAFALEKGIIKSDSEADLANGITAAECKAAVEATKAAYLSPADENIIHVEMTDNLIPLNEIPTGQISITDHTITITGNAPEIESGDVVITAPTAEAPFGVAYKVKSVSEQNGNLVLETEKPELGDIYEDIDVHTTLNADISNFVWADGISMSPTATQEMAFTGDSQELHFDNMLFSDTEPAAEEMSTPTVDVKIPFEYSSDTFKKASTLANSPLLGTGAVVDLLNSSHFIYNSVPSIADFGGTDTPWKKTLDTQDYDGEGFQISGFLHFTTLAVATDLRYNRIFGTLEQAKLHLTTDMSAELSYEGTIGNEIKIGGFTLPIGATGLTVSVSVFLYVDAAGTLQAKASLGSESVVEYGFPENKKEGKPLIVRHISDGHTLSPEISAAIDLEAGADFRATLNFFLWGLVDAGVKVGADCSAGASFFGTVEATEENGQTIKTYTEGIELSSSVYMPILTVYVGSDDSLAGALGLSNSWEIIGKEKGAKEYPLFNESWVFWTETVILDGAGNEIPDPDDLPFPEEIPLPNTYHTRFEEVNMITYPVFSFDYPEDWAVTYEEVSPFSETVTIANQRGVSVTYSNRGKGDTNLGEIPLVQFTVDKITDSRFIPAYVQGTDYSGLGAFMVAELAGNDGSTVYAVLPESTTGQQIEATTPYVLAFSSWYAGNLAFIGEAPDGQFTPQEQSEVIAILSSFRVGFQ